MLIQIEKYNKFVSYIKNQLVDKNWDTILITINFHHSGSYGESVQYFHNKTEFEYISDIFETSPLMSEIFDDSVLTNEERGFNKVTLKVTKNDYSASYEMVEEKVLEELQSSALIFSHYLYEKMRVQIYEYEVANNLRKPIYDEQGIAYDYEQSWDGGLFTFVVDANTQSIQHTIELSLKGKKRILPLDLRDDYKEAILIHHELTHDKLKEFWKPWTKIEVIAPEHIIPVGKEQNYIKYY